VTAVCEQAGGLAELVFPLRFLLPVGGVIKRLARALDETFSDWPLVHRPAGLRACGAALRTYQNLGSLPVSVLRKST
jgi:hypothetical protein